MLDGSRYIPGRARVEAACTSTLLKGDGMRFFGLLIATLLMSGWTSAAGAQPAPPPANWNNDAGGKVMGLMEVWGAVKYTFPHVGRLEAVGWDQAVRDRIPQVIAAEDVDSYYAVLMELVALLGDSHTMVLPPWGHLKPGYDIAPIEVRVIDGHFFIDRVGERAGFAEYGVVPGAEIVDVDGVPVAEHFEETVLRYKSWGSDHANAAGLGVYLLYGPAGGTNRLTVAGLDGSSSSVDVVRDAMSGDAPFMTRQLASAFAGPTIQSRMLDGGIQYVEIPNFEHDAARADFEALVDGFATNPVKGLILDLRWNMGGSSRVSNPMVGCLIDEPVNTPTMRYRHYVGARVAWGHEEIWEDVAKEVRPREGARFSGPVVVLVGALTNSSAEDFALELRAAGRATLVGQRTAGGAGNALTKGLPGGGTLRVATFTALTQDGEEYVGKGFAPDVEVEVTRADLAAGRDVTLARAVELLAGH